MMSATTRISNKPTPTETPIIIGKDGDDDVLLADEFDDFGGGGDNILGGEARVDEPFPAVDFGVGDGDAGV